MPRMTTDLLVRCTGHARKKRDETTEQFLRRITHLYCSEKGIDKIEGLSKCSNLTVLYLYDNLISSIDHLASCPSLTHLYLQNNHITHMANLTTLHRLTKLYLNGNAITVVEGLEGLSNLTELHIANQRLPEGEKLLFDPRSLLAVSDTIFVLNVSGNSLDTLEDLVCLKELEHLSACDNELSSMKNLGGVLMHLSKVTKLELSGNPICQKHKYRDRIITMGEKISMVDGKEVTDTERQFLVNWKAMRKARRRHQRQQLVELPDPLSSDHTIPQTKQIVYRAPPPLTMPALPPRQLPRHIKHQHSPAHAQLAHYTSNSMVATHQGIQEQRGEQSRGVKLPEIVSAYNIGTMNSHRSMMNSISPMKKPPQLKPIHVYSEGHF